MKLYVEEVFYMPRLFLGKFSNKYPEQIQKRYYAAGEEGNPWYGDVKPGDYVFAAYEGKIIGLWRAREYTQMKNAVNPNDDGVLLFNEIKTYKDVSVTNDFTRYKHFIHDLNLVNKVTKMVKNLGFIPIRTTNTCPMPEDIEFKANTINIYIALEDAKVDYRDGDIRVLIDNIKDTRILRIERFYDGRFILYRELNELYEERNKEDGKYTIRELNEFAVKDNASKKRNFLVALIEELERSKFYKVADVIKLYDNLLVGRKRSAPTSHTPEDVKVMDKSVDDDYLEDNDEYEGLAALLNFNPNLILYGPPGTGKTYATQNIIDAFEKKYFKKDSGYLKAKAEDRIRSITFHQSFSYEEFIEGIRPVLSDDEGAVGYRLENGIFKEFCINAGKELIKRKDNAPYIDRINSDSTIWKISLGERKSDVLYNECIKENEIAIGWLPEYDLSEYEGDDIMKLLGNKSEYGDKPIQDANTIGYFAYEMKVGDIVLVYNSPETIRKIGIINSEYFYKKADYYVHRRKVEWLHDLDYPINIKKYNNNKVLAMKTVYKLSKMSVSDVVNIVTQHSKEKQSLEDKHQIKPYYMVIDEINRGNISKIFGELITLIEQDKRGQEAVLPYSKKAFMVPGNLYIIGTMNTADRSIAAIDTALRRRFAFAEIEPDSSILAEYDNPIINDYIDLTRLMDAINGRILEKYDRDHRLGHAYFMGIDTLTGLYNTWYYKIIPLLSEYFYNDVSTLTEIVGNSFFDKHGNVKYLSLDRKENGHSEFEEQIRSIYMEKSDG
jgi:5-methylcytosine-specific restriction protein B